MNLFAIRWLTVATTIGVCAVMIAGSMPPVAFARTTTKPRGWFHQQAMQAFERKQLAMRDSIVRIAQAQLGTPYVFGGASPGRGFDCSGLVRWVFAQVHLRSPRLAAQQARIGDPVERARLSPGDLLTFGRGDSVTHVGIYIGDGRFVHASSVAGRVIVSPLSRPPNDLIKPLVGARRILATAATSVGGI